MKYEKNKNSKIKANVKSKEVVYFRGELP